MSSPILEAWNGEALDAARVPLLATDLFQSTVAAVVEDGGRIASLFGRPADGGVLVTAVLADDTDGKLKLLSTRVDGSWPSMAGRCPAIQAFERELAEQWGVRAEAHPWFKPLRFEPPFRAVRDAFGRKEPGATIPGEYPFFEVEGEQVHEVAVGPVHAGVIEPGHFRFQCHGEEVFHLEIVLGYQHRGVERALQGGPDRRTVPLVESIAGDTVIGHALAYAGAVEALAGAAPPARALALRGVALELERLANHVGDLGAIANDVAFLPTASTLGARRADYLNALAEICGNRFGRGLVVPGGTRFDLTDDAATALAARVRKAWAGTRASANLLLESPSVRGRTDGTGVVSREVAVQLGLVGPAARACGVSRDARRDHASGIYRFAHIPVVTAETGDVLARALVRVLEAEKSAAFVVEQLEALPEGGVRAPVGALAPRRLVATLVEGWRGELVHVAITDGDGRFARYKVKDPSFHNWMGLAMALRGEQISDFPLCNKSFNLSYCGHDL
jgi:Ni,Fe-hydrogenase III large subunit